MHNLQDKVCFVVVSIVVNISTACLIIRSIYIYLIRLRVTSYYILSNQSFFPTVDEQNRTKQLDLRKMPEQNSLVCDKMNNISSSGTLAQGTTNAQVNSPQTEMLSAEVLRSSIQPLGMNNSLNIQRNENVSEMSSSMSSFMQSGQGSVPLDRPLFINTNMTNSQRIDIYRRLSNPPQDSEPTLQFRWN